MEDDDGMGAGVPTTDSRSRRAAAASAAASAGGLASLMMALLGPPAPVAGPPPTVPRRGRPTAVTAAPWYRWRGVVFDHAARIDVIGAEPTLLDEGCGRLESLALQWRRAQPRPEPPADLALAADLALSADSRLLASLAARQVPAPPGYRVGLAAALAVDLVVADLVEGGAAGARVRVGGYQRVVGASPCHGGWAVPVATAPRSAERALRLQRGAVATLRAPVGCRPVRAVTVVSAHAWRAYELAVAAARWYARRPVGAQAGGALSDGDCAAACLVLAGGRVVPAGRWEQMLAPPDDRTGSPRRGGAGPVAA